MILGLLNIIEVKHKMSSTSFSTFTRILSVSFSFGSMDIAMIRKQYGRKLLMLNI